MDPAQDVSRRNAIRHSVHLALFSAVAVALGYQLMEVPIELVTFVIVLAGVCKGPRAGLAVGLIVEFIYRGFNPLGSSFAVPWLFLAQLGSSGFAGFCGGLLRKSLLKQGLFPRILSAMLGLLLTMISQFSASLSFVLVSGDFKVLWGWLMAGSVFTIGYIAWNTAVFTVLPGVARGLRERNPSLFIVEE